ADTSGEDTGFSIELLYWRPKADLVLQSGKAFTGNTKSFLDFPRNNQGIEGATISFPAGRNNALRASYFRLIGRGGTYAPEPLLLLGEFFDRGIPRSTRYKVQNVKISWDYLTYPAPPLDARFRFKTLWEVQYTTVSARISGPVTVDSSGGTSQTVASGS